MKLVINKSAINRNILRAEELAGVPVSIMLKSFYEYLFTSEMKTRKVFSANIEGSVCYSIGDASKTHCASVVSCERDFQKCYMLGISTFYIPINAHDNREGLSLAESVRLARYINSQGEFTIFGMITCGCISPDAPSLEEIRLWWEFALVREMHGISIGGSFYIAELKKYLDNSEQTIMCESGAVISSRKVRPPRFITDIRIGEYALFGTIPYHDAPELTGDNALTVQMEVIGVHRERGQIVVKGGYSCIDTRNCTLLSGGLKYVNTSSEYTIYEDPFKRYNIGDTVEVVPDYYSLVKLQYVEREYTK